MGHRYEVVTTGYPTLDRLIGYQAEAAGPPEVSGERGQYVLTTQPLRETSEPLGFPRGRITVVEGPEIPAEWVEGSRDSEPIDTSVAKWLLSIRPTRMFLREPELPWRIEGLVHLAQQTNTAFVIVAPEGLKTRSLMYYAYMRLRFAEGQVKVIKNAISATQGQSMKWPDGEPPAPELDDALWDPDEDLEKQQSLIKELRAREKTLIDLCHKVDQGLQALPASEKTPAIEALIQDLEAVRLWWYPVDPKVGAV